jgi:hypothetical protein
MATSTFMFFKVIEEKIQDSFWRLLANLARKTTNIPTVFTGSCCWNWNKRKKPSYSSQFMILMIHVSNSHLATQCVPITRHFESHGAIVIFVVSLLPNTTLKWLKSWFGGWLIWRFQFLSSAPVEKRLRI